MPLDDLCRLGEVAEMIIGGWRYVFSRSFRLKKHREWREQGWIPVIFDIGFWIAGVALSLGALVLALRYGFAWLAG